MVIVRAGTNLMTASVLEHGTYLGGSGIDYIYDFAVGDDDLIYVVGQTSSADFPTTTSRVGSFVRGPYKGFIAKYNSTSKS